MNSAISPSLYALLVAIHVLIGGLLYLNRSISIALGFIIVIVGAFLIIRNRNVHNEYLMVAAYIVGAEVLLRMTKGLIGYDFFKYILFVFTLVAFYFSGLSRNAVPYWVFLVLLMPGIIIGALELGYETNIRKAIMFNILGPILLVLFSLYCYQREVTLRMINNILFFMGLPIISTTVYLILYTPELKDVLVNTASNASTSGGYGPNQVSTVLGLGFFIFFTRILFFSRNKLILLLNVVLTLMMLYRGLLTFSRGGMITGFVMVVVLLGMTFLLSNSKAKSKLIVLMSVLSFSLIGIWTYTEFTTSGLISKRYNNQDALGREKEGMMTGREGLMMSEVQMFLDSPVFGQGVGKGREYRIETSGIEAASHNEATRMLGEHGAIGIIGLCLLIFTPLILYLDNRENLFMFCFITFWFLTINHAAMRLAAPAFVYGLSVLKVVIDDKVTLHRK